MGFKPHETGNASLLPRQVGAVIRAAPIQGAGQNDAFGYPEFTLGAITQYPLPNSGESLTFRVSSREQRQSKIKTSKGQARLRQGSGGQAMPYMLVMMVVLVISWAMMVNIAKLLQERMMMQNAADNAALSVAVYKARVLNTLGYLNYLMACTLYDGEAGLLYGKFIGGEPLGVLNYCGYCATGGPYGICSPVTPAILLPMFLNDSQKRVGSYLDMQHGHCPGTELLSMEVYGNNMARIRKEVFMLRIAQESFYFIFPANAALYAGKVATKNCEGYEFNVSKGNVLFSPDSLSLGLLQNSNGIVYYNTKSICESIPPVPLTGYPGHHAHAFWTTPAIPVPLADKCSWMYADSNRFGKCCKVMVMLTKKIEKKDFLFSKWLGLDDATISVVSAAGVYNRKGPMFPVEPRGHPSDKISPVFKEYLKAKDGGWEAHLVPVKTMEIQH